MSTTGATKATLVKKRPIKTLFLNMGLVLSGKGDGPKHNSDSLRRGSDAFTKRRDNQWQKQIRNK